jgi:integrase/recombinase XerD
MLFVYSRHAPDCAHKDELKYRRCRCPKWIDGYVDGERVRQSAKTRSWEHAERNARLLEDASDPAKPPQPKVMTIADAVNVFMADEKGRSLSKETTKQSKTLFEKQLLPWAKHRGLNRLRDLTSAELVNFRATWKNNGLTSNRKLSRLVRFFAFCIQNGWLNENPAMKVKRSAPTSLPTGWFPKTEFQRIVDATYAYGEWRGGRDFHFRADRLRALVLLMRWSGLSIQDAVTLERERLSDDGKIFLYRAKTGFLSTFPFLRRLPIFCAPSRAKTNDTFFGLETGIPGPLVKAGTVRLRVCLKSQRFTGQTEVQNDATLTCSAIHSRSNC